MSAARSPAPVHAGMSVLEMVRVAGLDLRRSHRWIFAVYSPTRQRLFEGTRPAIKAWLRRESYVA